MSQPSSCRRTSLSNHIWAVFIRSFSGFSPSLDAVFSHPLRGSSQHSPASTSLLLLAVPIFGRQLLAVSAFVDVFLWTLLALSSIVTSFFISNTKKTKKQKNQKLLCAFPLSFALSSFRSFFSSFFYFLATPTFSLLPATFSPRLDFLFSSFLSFPHKGPLVSFPRHKLF